MTRLFEDTPTPCPSCTQTTARPIIYGDASEEMTLAAQLGQIALGGVPTEGAMPQWLCPCGTRYGD